MTLQLEEDLMLGLSKQVEWLNRNVNVKDVVYGRVETGGLNVSIVHYFINEFKDCIVKYWDKDLLVIDKNGLSVTYRLFCLATNIGTYDFKWVISGIDL